MSKRKNKSNQDKIAAKKAAVLGTAKRSRMPLFGGIFVVILIAAAAVFCLSRGGGNPSAIASAPASNCASTRSSSPTLAECGARTDSEVTR